MSLLRLLGSRRFLPLFVVQFLGAFNDNAFKNALVILVTYQFFAHNNEQGSQLVNIAYGLFIVPILLFSYLAGVMADKVDRTRIAQWIKCAEIILALLGGIGFYFQNIPLLLLVVFGFGTHSTFFGPVKYAILPQYLREDELIAGNGLIEAGTFIAILAGIILSGLLILNHSGIFIVSALIALVAVLGWLTSLAMPKAPPPAPELKLSLNIVMRTIEMVYYSVTRPDEFRAILGISWFWFIGAFLLAQTPGLVKALGGNQQTLTLFFVIFTTGIALGSFLCAQFIKGKVRPTFIPLGALGMSLFILDLYLNLHRVNLSLSSVTPNLGIKAFLQQGSHQHIALDLLGLALCSAFYIVPLYTFLQIRADKHHTARSIATNNFFNALFMVVAAILPIVIIRVGYGLNEMVLTVTILSFVVTLYICKLLPLSLFQIILKLMYRVELKGIENWDKAGERVLIIANHTSFLDAPILASFLPESIGFAINTHVATKWWMTPFLKLVPTYPIDPTNPMATKSLIDRLKHNTKIMIFPEGRITLTGSLMKIYEGAGMVADKSEAMILPIRIDGAQYSPLSRLKGKVRIRWFPKITVTILPPQKFAIPTELMGRKRRLMAANQLYDLMSKMVFQTSLSQTTLIKSLLEASVIHGKTHIIADDPGRRPLTYKAFITRIFALAWLLKPKCGEHRNTVGLMLPNMVVSSVAFFALQALGHIVAMINFTSGAGQISKSCETVGLKTVISSRQFIEVSKLELVVTALEAADIKILYLEDILTGLNFRIKLLTLFSGFFPRLVLWKLGRVTSNEPAVILFTSGSEGSPKGVVLSSANILANRYQLASRVDFGPQDIVFNCLPMFHSFGLTGGTLLPLLAGVKVFFYPSPLHYRIVPELVYDCNATILFGTDTFLAGYAKFANPYDFYALRYVFAGAEALKEETSKVWINKFGLRIFEGYGATETSPVISVNTAMHYRAGTVGRLLPGLQTKLEGVEGITLGKKLWVKGPNIMLGYIKEDQKTILQPLTDAWYDTGDIVVLDSEGFLSIVGRVKRFAKIAGEMVSLEAIQNVIKKLWPAFNHAIISTRDPKKGERLILITDYAEATDEKWNEFFRGQGLSPLYIPSQIIKVETMPLLGSGKIDYQTLQQSYSVEQAL